MEYCVDRIEAGVAVLETPDGVTVQLSLAVLPEGTKEGSVLRKEAGVFALDNAAAEARRAALFALQEALLSEDAGEPSDNA